MWSTFNLFFILMWVQFRNRYVRFVILVYLVWLLFRYWVCSTFNSNKLRNNPPYVSHIVLSTKAFVRTFLGTYTNNHNRRQATKRLQSLYFNFIVRLLYSRCKILRRVCCSIPIPTYQSSMVVYKFKHNLFTILNYYQHHLSKYGWKFVSNS